MARVVPPWLWAVTLRDHGPRDRMMLLVLHTLRTYMDDSGYCYPSQEQIASAAAVSIRTVRNKLLGASRLQWIGMRNHARPGQQWQSYSYTACIPDHVRLGNEKYEQLAQTWASQYGDVAAKGVTGGLSKSKAPARRAGSFGGSTRQARDEHQSTGKSGTKHRHATTEVPANDDSKHRHGVPTNSEILSSHELPFREGAALARATACLSAARRQQSSEERIDKARRLLRECSDMDHAKLQSMYNLTADELRQALGDNDDHA